MRYAAPENAAEAAGLLQAEPGMARVLAGGSDILVQLRTGFIEPDLLVDIKRIAGINDITAEDGGFRIGAAVSGAKLGEHAGVRALWPGIVEAVELIGSAQIQGRATMAGNLCNASPAADSVPAMMAARAIARIVGPDGQRDCPVEDIPLSPGRTSLAKGEFITSIYLPARPANATTPSATVFRQQSSPTRSGSIAGSIVSVRSDSLISLVFRASSVLRD